MRLFAGGTSSKGALPATGAGRIGFFRDRGKDKGNAGKLRSAHFRSYVDSGSFKQGAGRGERSVRGHDRRQSETAKVGEKNSKQVFDKMATAAAALGWPEQIVDAARAQMQGIGDIQAKTMAHIRNAWEEQLKNSTAASPEAILSKLKSMPGFGSANSLPNAEALQAAATAPLALWMEFGKQWQQFWLESMNKASRG